MIFRGGIRIGSSYLNSINFTWPFVKVMFEDDCIRIRITLISTKEYVVLYKNINRISYKKGLFSKGVIIEHNMPSTPRYIIFWTRKVDLFLLLCEKHRLKIGNSEVDCFHWR